MEKSRYVVEYLAEGGSDVESMFVEATSTETASQIVLEKCGAFSTILSAQLTKSCGGSGKTATTTSVPETDEAVSAEVSAPAVKSKKEKTVKETPAKAPKAPRVTNTQKVATQTTVLKASGGTKEELLAWVLENVTSSESMAAWHVKQNWKLV